MITQDRWYQTEAVQSLVNYFDTNNGNPIIALPTGSGKSRVIAMFLHMIYSKWPWHRVLMLTHVKELIAQNYKAIKAIWPDAPIGIFSAGLGRKEITAPITYAGVASIVSAIELFGRIDLLIIDEAHLLGPSADGMYMRIIIALKLVNPKLKVIGLTATPWRTGMGLLTNGDIFTDICYDLCTIAGFKRLFAENYLVPPRTKPMQNEISTAGVAINGNEFSVKGLQNVTRDKEITWKALQESINKNSDRSVRLTFCTGIEHSIVSADMLRALGCRAVAVHSNMHPGERDDIISGYLSGYYDTLCNNGIATTGLDYPAIDHIISLRATMSVGLWVQKLGRGTRPYEINGWHKKDCMVSDHARNAARLGPIDDPYIPKLKGKGTGEMPVKLCTACGTYNHTSARVCEWCGEPFELKVKYTVKAHEDVIVRSDLPVYETFEVKHVYYTQYLKRGATPETKPTLKAVYNCGSKTFKEYIPIEAERFRKRAIDWWRQRFPADGFMPTTVDEAMHYVDRLVPPKAIKVWTNRQYPEIVGYEY